MNIIARWTTPSITYRPKAVEVANIDEIFLVLKRGDKEIIRKGKDDAVVDENGFTWFFAQEETALLFGNVYAQVDYISGATRYTTVPKPYTTVNSAINEVI